MENENLIQMTTKVFGKSEIKDIFKKVVSALLAEGIEEVNITYGFAWGNEMYENEWLPLPVPTAKLEALVEKESDKGEIGSDDFFIELKNQRTTIQFCHENDVHLEFEEMTGEVVKIREAVGLKNWTWEKRQGEAEWKKIAAD